MPDASPQEPLVEEHLPRVAPVRDDHRFDAEVLAALPHEPPQVGALGAAVGGQEGEVLDPVALGDPHRGRPAADAAGVLDDVLL